MRRLCLTLLSVVSFWALSSWAWADVTIALVGKTKNDSFYVQAFSGCQAYADTVGGLTCFFDGPMDYQDPRGQARVIDDLLERGVDGILVSVTDSSFLVKRVLQKAQKLNVPVLTFDSDLLPQHHAYRIAYVGTDNFDFGRALGNYAAKFKAPNERKEICIQSGGDTTPNLNDRIRGVRYALSGGKDVQRLTGENGWVEHKRCPFYTLGKRAQALIQLQYVLAQEEAPLFLAVAGFAQFSEYYIDRIRPHRAAIERGEKIIISADAEARQLDALRQGLSTANIGQRPYEMGRYGAKLLHDVIVHDQMPEREINYLGYFYCRAGQEELCSLTP